MDLLKFLIEECKKTEHYTEMDLNTLEGFRERSIEILKKNPPISLDFTIPGAGIILSDRLRLSFLPADRVDHTEFKMYQGEIPVTSLNRPANMDEIYDVFAASVNK